MKIERQAYGRIAIYYIIAITLSGVFRLGLFEWYNNMVLPFGLTPIVKALCEGSGPLIGALIVLRLTKNKPEITLFGTQRTKSLLMITPPILLFTIFGANNDINLNRHFYGFLIGLAVALYGIFEEYGWRGYLQNELKDLRTTKKYLVVGLLWYFWHLSFLTKDTTIPRELMFLGIIVFASMGLGGVADKTKSVIASACFHILGNILFISSLISTAVDDQTRYIIFGICLAVGIFFFKTWDKTLKPKT